MLSPFHIRNLRPTQPKMTQDSLVRVSAPGYDKTISTNSAARLKYQDEDDGGIITVGSSTELVQRLEEPVPQKSRGAPQSSRNPMSIATLLAESQQTPPSLTHHIFDIEDREEVRKLWQDIQVKNNNSKSSADIATKIDGEAKPLSRDSLENDQGLRVEKNDKFARAYDKLRSTIWTPLARELGISWWEAEKLHWSLGENILRREASAEIFESLSSTDNEASDPHEAKASTCTIDFHSGSSPSPSPEFSDYRTLHFNSTMPPQLRSVESIGTTKSHAAGGQMRSSIAAKPAANLTIEGKRQAQAAGDKLRARTMPSRHRIVATAVDHTNHQNRWATYKSPSSAFFPKDDPASSQSFDSPGLTSEGKRQAQVAGDKLRNRTNPIRHSRPSRGSVSEHGISKNRWSSYGPRVTRLDERRDSQAESNEKLLPGEAGISENKGQPSLLELFEVELAKKMTANDSCHENSQAIESEVSTTTSGPSNHAIPTQEEAQQESNPILNGLKSINNDLQGLALGAEDLPQEFPRAIGQGFRAALGGLSVFVRSVTNGLQEASTLTRQAAEHTREANLQAIDDTIVHLRTVAGEVKALSREILPVSPKTNEDSKEDKVCIVPTASDPPTESKTPEAVYNAPDENLQHSVASDLESPVSVADRTTIPEPSSPSQANPPKHVSDIPVSITRSIRTDNHRISRSTGMSRAPHYHKPGPIHLPHHSPVVQNFMGEAQTTPPRSGYVDHLRYHQSVETGGKTIEEPDKSGSTNLPAAATRFPTLAQFEDQNFASGRPFPPLPSMNMEPLVPLKPNSQSASQTSSTPSPVLSEDHADNSRSVSVAKSLLSNHGINPDNLTENQFQSFQMQNPAVQQKSIQIYAQNLRKRQRQQNNSTNPETASDQKLPVDLDQDPLPASAGKESLLDYQMQLKLLEEQNKKRILLARMDRNFEERETQLERPVEISMVRQAIAQQELNEVARRSSSPEGPSTSRSDYRAHAGILPASPKSGGVGNNTSQECHEQSNIIDQQCSEKRRAEEQNEDVLAQGPIQQPKSFHSESPDDAKVPMHHSVSQASDAKRINEKDARKRHSHSLAFVNTPSSSGMKLTCMVPGCQTKFDTEKKATAQNRNETDIPRQPNPQNRRNYFPGFLRTPSASGIKLTCMVPHCQKTCDTEKEAMAHARSGCQNLPTPTPQGTKPHFSLGLLQTPSASGMKFTCMASDCQKKFDTAKEGAAHIHSACRGPPGPHSQSSAQGDSPSTQSDVRDRLTPQQSQPINDGSSAARLVEPFDPLEAEPAARPHLTEGIRRNATVACTDNKLNARRRRPYSEAFDGNGRIDWGQSLKNGPNTQRNAASSKEREESVRKSPVSHRRTLGSRYSFESDDNYYRPDTHRVHRGSYDDLPDSGYPKWNNGHRDVPKSISPMPVPMGRRPYVPRLSTHSPAPAPPMHFESPEQKRKIQSCVMQLKGLGFGNDGANGEERLMQCASAAGGDLVEAIDMIDEEQRAYRDRDLGMKPGW